jgi:hypothetical protein
MSGMTCTLGRQVRDAIVQHLVARIEATPAIQEPFTHVFLQNVFPDDIYKQMLDTLPNHETYAHAADRHYGNGKHMRSFYNLSKSDLTRLPSPEQSFWATIASALTAEEVKCAMFRNLAVDLSFRYGVPEAKTAELPAYSRPVLYRETEGFEIPPHPDTRKKVVTMHFYLPADKSQLDLGTALYRRRLLAWPFGSWQRRFEKVKQFPFEPNSAYAFVVNNKITRKSWHGREQLPPGAGVRNTLLNTFYEEAREDFLGYAA